MPSWARRLQCNRAQQSSLIVYFGVCPAAPNSDVLSHTGTSPVVVEGSLSRCHVLAP